MMNPHDTSRREFLRRASVLSGTVRTAGLPFAMNLAAMNAAVAQTSDYKAIVCLFLYGGNDSANMVLPTDTASWEAYQTVRSTAPDPIALKAVGTLADAGAAAATPAALGGVLPIVPNFTAFNVNNTRTFALHPSMGEMKSLFDQARVGIIANAGPLLQPMTKEEYRANTTKKRPPKLFSHND
ncbi:MAG: Tat pathway signal protein, partial [Rhizobacter sp.]